jgi:hypothetical protein
MDVDIPWADFEILPRDYGFSALRGTEVDKRKYFIFPSKFAIGAAILKTEKQLESDLACLVKSIEDGKYHPVILPADTDMGLLTSENMEQAIKETEGVFNLWRDGGDKAVRDYKSFGSTLTAQVRSVKDGRGKGAYRKVAIGSPSVYAFGKFGQLFSGGDDFYWASPKGTGHMPKPNDPNQLRKGTYSIDNYIAALLTKFAQDSHPNNPDAYLPIGFVKNPLLGMEMLVARYLQGMSFFEIDKILVDNEEVVNPNLVDRVEKGYMRLEIMQQKKREPNIEPAILLAEAKIRAELTAWLRKEGYTPQGIYIEFKATEYETPAEAWQKEGKFKGLLFSRKFPPLIISRGVDERSQPSFFAKEDFGGSPLRSIGIRTNWMFDLQRRPTITYLDIPLAITEERMVQLRPLYREMLEKNATIKKDELIRKYNL